MEVEEEVILESSPLYQHLQEMELERGDAFTHSAKAISTSFTVRPNQGYNETLNDDSVPQTNRQLSSSLSSSFKEVDLAQRQDLCSLMLESPQLVEEHYIFLKALIENYFPLYIKTDMPTVGNNHRILRLLAHGGIAYHAVRHSSVIMKSIALASLVVHVSLPFLMDNPKWRTSSIPANMSTKMSEYLEIFKTEDVVWKSVQRFCQEINLVSRGAVIINKKRSALSACVESQTLSLRKAANLHIMTSIEALHKDIQYLSTQLDNSELSEFGINTLEFHIDDSYDMAELQLSHRQLHLLISQWIVLVTLVIVSPKTDSRQLSFCLQSLQGIQFPEHLQKELKFRKALVDGEFESKIIRSKTIDHKFRTEESQAVHSLYLHSRELLRLAKLADNDSEQGLGEQQHKDISQQLQDCRTCLERAGKRNSQGTKVSSVGLKIQTQDDGRPLPTLDVIDQPITDQVFVTEAGVNDQDDEREGEELNDYEAKLRREYETLLMRELQGVISELARERVEREHNLTDSTDSTTAESLAKATKEIVESRDIKALVKKAADSLEQQRDVVDKSVSKPDRVEKYRYSEDSEEMTLPSMRQPKINMRDLANQVASQYTQQFGEAETFGSDESESEDEGDDDS